MHVYVCTYFLCSQDCFLGVLLSGSPAAAAATVSVYGCVPVCVCVCVTLLTERDHGQGL